MTPEKRKNDGTINEDDIEIISDEEEAENENNNESESDDSDGFGEDSDDEPETINMSEKKPLDAPMENEEMLSMI